MFRSPLHMSALPLGVAVIALAGCGSQAAAKPTSVSQATTPGAATPGAVTPGAVSPAPVATAPIPSTPIVTGAAAAYVNGHAIPLSKFRLLLVLSQRASAAQLGHPTAIATLTKQTMDEVIINELVRQYAVKHNISITAADVAQQQQKDIAQSGGQANFDKTLARYGMSVAQYQELISTNLLGVRVEKAIAPVKTTQQRVAHVRHILISLKPLTKGQTARTDAQAKALAEKILNELKHGANFAQLAKKYSNDTGSAIQGGDLGTVYPGQTVAPFNQAVFSQPLLAPTLVKSQFGYHVIEVLSRGMAPGQPSQAQQLAQRTAFTTWIADQKKHATIKETAQVKG